MTADHAPGLERWLGCTPREGSCRLAVAQGALPPELAGTYYLIGPGVPGRGDLRYRHWLDGDGLVTRVAFEPGAAPRATHRFVASTKHLDEEAAGRALYRTFGTAFPGDRLRRVGLESPVNVSVYPWHGTLLASGEQGLPWELDPETLETRGEYRFGGRLNEVSPLSAHPTLDTETGDLWSFGISYAPQQPSVTLYHFAAGALAERFRFPLPYPCSIHDFGLSPHYALWHVAPHLLDVAGVIAGTRSVNECLTWEPERGTELLIAGRDGALRARLPLPEGYCLHWIRAWEDGPYLVADLVELERPVYDQYEVLPDLFTNVRPGGPVRYVIDTRTWELTARIAHGYRLAPDFPTHDLRRQPTLERCQPPLTASASAAGDDFWLLGISATGRPGRKFFDQLAHLALAHPEAPRGLYQAPAGRYLGGEPVFAPHVGNPAAGWVLCLEFDPAAERVDLCLFDAFAVAEGPVARLPLSAPIPPGFHASWANRGA